MPEVRLVDQKIKNETDLDHNQLIEKLDSAIYICNADGTINFYNHAAAVLWGREPELGKDLWCGSWKIYHPDGAPMMLEECPMAIALKTGKETTDEVIVVERPDGIRRFINPHPKVLRNNKGEIVGAINMLLDVTEGKMTEKEIGNSETRYRLLAESLEKMVTERTRSLIKKNEELRKSEDRYHKMIAEIQDYAIILLDKDGIIMNWNKGAENIKGYTEKEIIGKSFEIFYLPKDRESGLPKKLIARAIEEGRAQHEGWRKRKDGTTFWGSIVITSLHDEDNNVIGFTKVTRDLTERKIAEDKIRQYAKNLEFQNRELEQFAFAASHDLQEPLRKIQTFSELVIQKMDDKEQAERYLQKINSSANHMSSLIKDVLSYSMLSTVDSDFTTVNLNEVLKSVREDLEALIEERNVTIVSTDLPLLQGITVQFYQLFYNLINNSIKFSDINPHIEISADKADPKEIKSIEQLDPTFEYIKLSFKDNGCGFESKFGDKIFKLFQRLYDSKSGNGIGLALCKRIIENHHGYITAESTPGDGATFTVYLPVI